MDALGRRHGRVAKLTRTRGIVYWCHQRAQWEFLQQLSESSGADWSRAKVYESMDHGSDVTFSEKLRRKLKINVIVKNKSTTIFHCLHLFKTLQWNHSPTARGSTWVLNILWSHFYGLLECRPVDLLNEARSCACYLCDKHACFTDFNSSISHISAPVISDYCSARWRHFPTATWILHTVLVPCAN